MPRPRKIDSEQFGHLTAVQKAKKERETELARGDATLIKRPPKDLLLDDAALKKWKYLVKVKREEQTLSNADYDNLVVYCNAWSNYLKSVEFQTEYRSDAEMMAIALRMEKQSTDLLYRYGARLGLDLNSRLKTAAVKVEKEQDALGSRFGGI